MTRSRTPFLVPLAAGLLLAGIGCQSLTQPTVFTHWPAGTSPQEIGKRVAENFAARPLRYETDPAREAVIYPEVSMKSIVAAPSWTSPIL